MLFSIPTGLGLATGDIRMMVLMFLIPGVAIYLASFLRKKVSARQSKARTDYASLLLLIGIVEIIVAAAALMLDSSYIIPICAIFVAIYAFSKEGIPRLLYSIDIYRYFADKEDRQKLVGLDQGAKVLAYFLGSLTAAVLIGEGSWQYGLLIDALTFVIFGATLFLGKDPDAEPTSTGESPPAEYGKELQTRLSHIAIIIPLVSFITCLYAPYLSLISSNNELLSASTAVFVIGLINTPIMLFSIYWNRGGSPSRHQYLLYLLPFLYMLSGIMFLGFINTYTLIFAMVGGAIYSGLFFPADYHYRSQLKGYDLIRFNTSVTRRFSLMQVISCSIAFLLFTYAEVFEESALSLQVVTLFIVAASWKIFSRRSKCLL